MWMGMRRLRGLSSSTALINHGRCAPLDSSRFLLRRGLYPYNWWERYCLERRKLLLHLLCNDRGKVAI